MKLIEIIRAHSEGVQESVLPGDSIRINTGDVVRCGFPFAEVSSVVQIDNDLYIIVNEVDKITFEEFFSAIQNNSKIQFHDRNFNADELKKLFTVQLSIIDQNNQEHHVFLMSGSSVDVHPGDDFRLNSARFDIKDLYRHSEDLVIRSYENDKTIEVTLVGFFKKLDEGLETPQLKIIDTDSEVTKDMIVHPRSAVFKWDGEPLPMGVVGSLYGYYFHLHGEDADNFILVAKTADGPLPPWLTFSKLGHGSYFLSGTPSSGNVGAQEILIFAHSVQQGIGLHTEQAFELQIRNNEDVVTRSYVADVASAEFRKAGELANYDAFSGAVLSVEQMNYITMPEIAAITTLAAVDHLTLRQAFSNFSTPNEFVLAKESIEMQGIIRVPVVYMEESRTQLMTHETSSAVITYENHPLINQVTIPVEISNQTTSPTTTAGSTSEIVTPTSTTTETSIPTPVQPTSPTPDNTVSHQLLISPTPPAPPAPFPTFIGVVDLPIYMDSSHGFSLSGTGGFNALNATIIPNSAGYDSLLIANNGTLSPFSRGFLISGQAQFPANVPFTDSSLTMTSFNNTTNSNPISATGTVVYSVSDLNGDNINDFLISSVNGSRSYVVFGDALGFPTNVSLASLGYGSPNTALEIYGANFFNAGALGDVNGDNFGDVILSNPGAGLAYVIFSNMVNPTGFAHFNVSYLTTYSYLNGGFTISGLGSGSNAYQNVTGVNFTGDGVNDIFVGFYNSSTQISSMGVIFGSTPSFSSTVNVSSSGIVGANGFLIVNSGASAGDVLINPTAIGNFTGNGFDDVALSSNNTVYVIFGSSSFLSLSSFDVTSLNGSNGFSLVSPNPSNITSISYVADVNGDGNPDFAFVDSQAYGGQGAVYVIFGSQTPLPSTIDYTALTPSEGFVIRDASGVLSTATVGGGGDLNGDGLGDIVITNAGNEYIVFGSDFFNTITILGTPGNDVLVGTTDDVIYGGAGNDTITALSGNNFIDGGVGANTITTGPSNDTIVYNSSDLSVNAGVGNDTLWLKNDNTHIDLRGTLVYSGIDTINLQPMLTMVGNSIILDSATILAMTDSNLITLMGDAHDLVNIYNASALWNISNVIAGFTTYTSHNGTVINIEDNVQVYIIPRQLSDYIDGIHGFALDSAPIYFNNVGRGVVIAPDINGDGYDELWIGVQNIFSYTATPVAEAYLVFGQTTFPSAHFEITDPGITSTQFYPITGGSFITRFVSAVGDFNGDGYKDIFVAPYSNKHAYVIFGDPGGFPSSVSLPALGTGGLDIFTSSSNFFTTGIALGDINGDGLGDVIVGSAQPGFGYAVLGSLTPPTSIDVTTLSGSDGFKIFTPGWSGVGNQFVLMGADINGDGYNDIFEKNYSTIAGQSYVSVILGHAGPFPASISTAALVPGTGFHIFNGSTSGYNSFAKKMANIGDINGDGYTDIALVGSQSFIHSTDLNSAAIYVIFGSSTFSTSGNFDVTTLNGTNGFGLIAPSETFSYITNLGYVGDVNGDGMSDFAFIDGQAYGTGALFVIFGTQSPISQLIDYTHLTPSQGFSLQFSSGYSGSYVGGGGDINGDGLSDIVIGSPGNTIGGQSAAGTAYVVYGQNFNDAISQMGTQGNDIITATQNNETIYGGAGDDTITALGGNNLINGGAGNDIINGGSGNDTIVYDSHDISTGGVNGGAGSDTLWFENDGNIADLRGTAIFTGMDQINLRPLQSMTGNEVILDPSTVNSMSDANSMIVSGGGHDSLVLHNVGLDVWSAGPVVLISGESYTTYTSSMTGSVVYGENTLHSVSVI